MPIRVLLADDNEIVRKAITRLLTNDQEICLVGEAINFTQAMKLKTELQPDVVVMDLHMRGETDVTPLYFKLYLAGSRLLAISLWQDEETKLLAESFGAARLLDKANLVTELIPTIKQLHLGIEAES